MSDVSELDQWLKPCGACAFCGFHDKRHRLWDAIMDRVASGDDPADVADDLSLEPAHVEAVLRIRPYADDPHLARDTDGTPSGDQEGSDHG